MIGHIVLATDFSECAIRAQDYAALLARAYDATLHVVHVPESPFWYGSHAATILYLEQAQKAGERQLWSSNNGSFDRFHFADPALKVRTYGVTLLHRLMPGKESDESRSTREMG